MGLTIGIAHSPRHFSSINSHWLPWACKALGLAVLERRRLSHETGSFPARVRNGCRVLGFWTTRLLSEAHMLHYLVKSIPIVGRAVKWTSDPMSHNPQDHLLVALTSRR